MQLKASDLSRPVVLVLFGAAGILLGLGAPTWMTPAFLLIHVSTSLLNLVCAPLLIVATLSGLRHLLGLPHPVRRLLMIVLVSVAILLICAQAGVLMAQWGQIGWQLDANSQRELGGLLMGINGSGDSMLFEPSQDVPAAAINRWALPDNVFFALSSGSLAAVMFCTVFFGLAFTAQRGQLADSTADMLEAASRALEKIIDMVNVALPLLVLAYAAQLASQWSPSLLGAMASFLLGFWILAATLSLGAVMVVFKKGTAPLGQVLRALKVPALLSLVIPSPLAWVPSSIEGLSNRLGFSRGIVEMLMPASAVFLRAGAALQYGMMAVFVAHLYGIQISATDAMMLAPVVMAAALASAGSSGLASLGFASVVVAYLELPFEAALPLFAAINLFTEGIARLLSLLCSCALAAFVCGGLPIEKQTAPVTATPSGPIRIALSRHAAFTVAIGLLLMGLLITVLGLAMGLR
jgi:Na+/H+-dicarboxylate symporter